MSNTGTTSAGDLELLATDFQQVAKLAGVRTQGFDIEFEVLDAPHTPPKLPHGKTGGYVFAYKGQTLKVGKVGPDQPPGGSFSTTTPKALGAPWPSPCCNMVQGLASRACQKPRLGPG